MIECVVVIGTNTNVIMSYQWEEASKAVKKKTMRKKEKSATTNEA